jgi:hypothetical protein
MSFKITAESDLWESRGNLSKRGERSFSNLIFQNRAITKKGFLLGHSVRNSNVHPVVYKKRQ